MPWMLSNCSLFSKFSCRQPTNFILISVLIETMTDISDLDHQIEQLRKCEVIKESDVKNLCAKAREILGKLIGNTGAQ